jgi:transposase
MNETLVALERWQLDVNQVREQVYRAPTPRERERWHALWLLARGWSAAQVAEALGRDAHSIGEWVEGFRQKGAAGLIFEQTGGSPPPLARRSRRS